MLRGMHANAEIPYLLHYVIFFFIAFLCFYFGPINCKLNTQRNEALGSADLNVSCLNSGLCV